MKDPIAQQQMKVTELETQILSAAKKCNGSQAQKWILSAVKLVDEMAVYFMMKALFVDMGWTPVIGQRITPNNLIRDFGVKRTHKALLKAVFGRFEHFGILKASGEEGTWIVVALPPTSASIISTIKQIQTKALAVPRCRTEVEFVSYVGRNFYSALTGKINPLDLLFPSENSRQAQLGAQTFYANSFQMEYTKSSYVIQAVIQTISSLQKAGQKEVRILEIGAGTGGTTRGVLDAIFKQSDVQDLELKYSYTDVSNFFLTKAEAIFVPQYPKVTFDFSVLDIELPNAEQGAFAIRTGENGYDMIIAADVFHVTKYLEDTLEHTRALLKPGGLLILGELFTGNASLELTFGLADGWWRFSDGIRTKGSPLINSDEWEVNLRKSGFVNTFSVCVCEGYSGVVFGFADDKTS